MKTTFTQYAMIATQWVPNNPIRAFLPFVYNYITTQNPQDISLEDFSQAIDERFELHLPYALLRSILEYLRRNSEATLHNGFWNFSIRDKNLTPTIHEGYEAEISALLEGFVEFVEEKNLPADPEELISSFFKRYDYEVMSGLIRHIKDEDLNVYDFFFSEYVRQLEKTNPSLFQFVVKIAQGSLIKTAITSENLQHDVLKNKVFYLDTKIIFRLLGYYGDYYQTEYTSLLDTLKRHGATVCISFYVKNEIESILRGCIRYIDSADYQYEKASDVLRYFRSLKMSKLDIETLVTTFDDKLKDEFGITIDNDNLITPAHASHYEDYITLKKILTSKYKYVNDEFSYVYDHGIETDVKSVLSAYMKRGNNEITLIKNAPLFFVTTNATLIKSTMQYHNDTYGKTLSPIISDTFLGVILYNNDNALDEYSKLKLLTYCSEFYKPTKQQREDFIAQVEKQNAAGKITDNDVFLLKHYELIDDVLVRQLRANDFNINDDCVFDALEEIRRETTKDVVDSYERKLNLQSEQYFEEINQIKETAAKEIEAKDIAHQAYKEKLLNEDMIKYQKIIKPIYYGFSSLMVVVFLVCSILPLVLGWAWDSKSIAIIVCSAVLLIFDIVQVAVPIIRNRWVLDKLIERRKGKLKKKYDLL